MRPRWREKRTGWPLRPAASTTSWAGRRGLQLDLRDEVPNHHQRKGRAAELPDRKLARSYVDPQASDTTGLSIKAIKGTFDAWPHQPHPAPGNKENTHGHATTPIQPRRRPRRRARKRTDTPRPSPSSTPSDPVRRPEPRHRGIAREPHLNPRRPLSPRLSSLLAASATAQMVTLKPKKGGGES